MAVYTGKDGTIKVGSDVITYIDTWSLSLTGDTVEANSVGSADKNYIPVGKGGTASISGTLNTDDSGQNALINQYMLNGTLEAVELHLIVAPGTVTDEEFTGQALVTGIEIGGAFGDKTTFSASAQFVGAITHNVKSDTSG